MLDRPIACRRPPFPFPMELRWVDGLLIFWCLMVLWYFWMIWLETDQRAGPNSESRQSQKQPSSSGFRCEKNPWSAGLMLTSNQQSTTAAEALARAQGTFPARRQRLETSRMRNVPKASSGSPRETSRFRRVSVKHGSTKSRGSGPGSAIAKEIKMIMGRTAANGGERSVWRAQSSGRRYLPRRAGASISPEVLRRKRAATGEPGCLKI